MPEKRILFTPASSVLAHVGRCVVLARELKARGHDVHLAGTAKYLQDPAIAHPGEFHIHPLDDFEVEVGLEILRKVRKLPPRHLLDEHIREELELLDGLRPDVVINDFRLTMYISARLRRRPVVSLLGGRWLYQFASRPYRAPRTHPIYPWLRRILGENGTDALVPTLQRWALRYKMRPYNRLSTQYGVPSPKNLWEFLIGEYNLILDTELLGPTGPLPSTFCRVGPIAWTPAISSPTWLEAVDRTRPIIYITMGSTGHPGLFQTLFEILGEMDYTLIVSTGGQRIPDGSLPRTAYVAKYMPGEEVMRVADLLIFHGGAGTGYQAVAAGIPSLVIATHLEQEFVGEVFEEQGAGIFLTMNQVVQDPLQVRKAVATILKDQAWYRANMRRLQEDFRRYDPVRKAADYIEGVLNGTPPAESAV